VADFPLVSILIPAYNASKWITQTVDSALAQTWPRKEIVIVDDGSKDDTLAIARRYEAANVLVTTHENQGAAATRNKAFSLCQGDLIQWLDADDLLSANKVGAQAEAFRRSGSPRTLLSCGWAYFMHRPQRARFTPTPLWADLTPAEWLIRKMSQNLHMQTATWLVSRELTEAAGLWNTQLLGDDDGEYFCRVLLASHGVRFVPDARVYYRVSSSAGLHYIGRSSPKMEAHFHSMRLHIKYLLSIDDSDRARTAGVTYLQNWLPEFYPERADIGEEAKELAISLGGRLADATLPWKYDWLRRVFGWSAAKRVQLQWRQWKSALLARHDAAMYRLESARVRAKNATIV
jgi:glycosyltransferase involved in cell wall biosynthesis